MQEYPKTVHLSDVEGYVELSPQIKKDLEKRIRQYGVCKLARDLEMNRETIDSIYRPRRGKTGHSIKHLLSISGRLGISVYELERSVMLFGRSQKHMYQMTFPFTSSPLHIRALSIQGDGSFSVNQAVWYQRHERIFYMTNLLRNLLPNSHIRERRHNKDISYVTIPSTLRYLVEKSLDVTDIGGIQFFRTLCNLTPDYRFQAFLQFVIDEGHFKNNTLTISQWKKETREGIMILMNSLGFEYSKPKGLGDITVYAFNYPIIIEYLNDAVEKYGVNAGFWFKEKQFRDIQDRCDPAHSFRLVSARI